MIRLCFPKLDSRNIIQFAEDELILPRSYGQSGPFRVGRSKYLVEPLLAIGDHRTRVVSIMAPIRSGKTLCIDIAIPFFASTKPGPIMYSTKDDSLAAIQWTEKILPVLQMCRSLRGSLPEKINVMPEEGYHLTNGTSLMCQGSALGGFQQRGVKYLLNDEIHLWKQGIYTQARGRVKDFERMGSSKIVNVSQAGEDGGEFDLIWKEGTSEIWHVQCVGCGQLISPTMLSKREDGSYYGLRWNDIKDDVGMWDIPKCMANVWYECICGHKHQPGSQTNDFWAETGRYIQTNDNPLPNNRSFFWSGLITNPWQNLARDFMRASNAKLLGNTQLMVDFFQKDIGCSASVASIDTDYIKIKRESYTVDGGLIKVMTVDVQHTHFWVMIRAWKDDCHSWRVHWGMVKSWAGIKNLQDEYKIHPGAVLVDSAFRPTGDDGTYYHCAVNGWIAIRGSPVKAFKHYTPTGKLTLHTYSPDKQYEGLGDPEVPVNGRRIRCKVIHYHANSMRDRLQSMIDRGLWHEPPDDGSEKERQYKSQMTAEKKIQKPNREWVWEQIRDQNHAFDCAASQVAFATIMRYVPDTIEEVKYV